MLESFTPWCGAGFDATTHLPSVLLNFFMNTPFLFQVLTAHLSGVSQWYSNYAAILFLSARLAHWICYSTGRNQLYTR
jgi:uncharacterized MAPEG superfamily protein